MESDARFPSPDSPELATILPAAGLREIYKFLHELRDEPPTMADRVNAATGSIPLYPFDIPPPVDPQAGIHSSRDLRERARRCTERLPDGTIGNRRWRARGFTVDKIFVTPR